MFSLIENIAEMATEYTTSYLDRVGNKVYFAVGVPLTVYVIQKLCSIQIEKERKENAEVWNRLYQRQVAFLNEVKLIKTILKDALRRYALFLDNEILLLFEKIKAL